MDYRFSMSEPVRGMRFCSVKTSRFKISNITATFMLPLGDGAAANALLPYLMRRCCKAYPTMTALNRRLAELYGAVLSGGVVKFGEAQAISLKICALDDRFSLDGGSIAGECARLLLDLIFEPHLDENGLFCEQDVEREKRMLIETVESELNDKKSYAMKRCIEIMCEGEAYSKSRFGTIEEISALTPQQVTLAWKNMLKTATVQFNVIGSADEAEILSEVSERFAGIDRGSLAKIETSFIKTAGGTKRVRETMDIKQGKLVLGYRAGMENSDDNCVVLKVMTDLFGGGPYSRLFTNVREKMSLCYYCAARIMRTKGIIMVQSGIEDENEQKAIDAITAELACLASGGFADSEFEASIKGITDTLLGVQDTPEGLDGWLTSQLFDEEVVLPEDYAALIGGVTRQQVAAAAAGVTLDTVYMLGGNNKE